MVGSSSSANFSLDLLRNGKNEGLSVPSIIFEKCFFFDIGVRYELIFDSEESALF